MSDERITPEHPSTVAAFEEAVRQMAEAAGADPDLVMLEMREIAKKIRRAIGLGIDRTAPD